MSTIPGTKTYRPWCAECGREVDSVIMLPIGRGGARVAICEDCDPTDDEHLPTASDAPVREYNPTVRLTVKEMKEGVTKLAESVRAHMPASMSPMSKRR